MSAFETAIEGYGKAGGMWGQLYSWDDRKTLRRRAALSVHVQALNLTRVPAFARLKVAALFSEIC
jgi:hypothetical protein